MRKMTSKEVLPFSSGRVVLFKRSEKDAKQSFYYYRIRLSDGTYLTKSTKQMRMSQAELIAEQAFQEVLLYEKRGLVYKKSTFKELSALFVSDLMGTKDRVDLISGTFERYFNEFFHNMPVESIDSSAFYNYVRWRCDFNEKFTEEELKRKRRKRHPSKRTILSEKQILIQFLFWCNEKRFIDSVPRIRFQESKLDSRVVSSRQRSKTIPHEKWLSIVQKFTIWAFYPRLKCSRGSDLSYWEIDEQTAQNWLVDNHGSEPNKTIKALNEAPSFSKKARFAKMRTFYFTMTAYHSMARPSRELASIKWSDIKIHPARQRKGAFIASINVRKSKKGKEKRVFATHKGTEHLLRWRKISRQFNLGGQNDLVFPRDDTGEATTAALIGRHFSRFLKKFNVKQDEHGRNITLYTFARHQRIKNALTLSKWSLEKVSALADVRLTTLSQFYHDEMVQLNPDYYAETIEDEKKKPALTPQESDALAGLLEEWL